MNEIRMVDDFKEYPAVIKIVGVGGAGGNALNRMIDSDVKGVEFIAANTDAQALRRSHAGLKLQIGVKVTKGLGVGGNPAIGKQAAEEDRDKVREALVGADMVFITAGMGGGTGTGAAPIFAEVAKELGALTIAVVTKPFLFEGKVRSKHAEEGIKELKTKVDTLVIIPNQRLFTIIDEATPAHKAWSQVDDVLRQGIQSISDVITSTGTVNVDFNDVKAIMTDAGQALMGMGESSGPNRAIEAAKMAMASPLLEDISIQGAMGLLVNITGGASLTMHEINEAMMLIYNAVSPEANVYFGQVFDESIGDTMKITVIATNFSSASAKKQSEPKDMKQDLFQGIKNISPIHTREDESTTIDEPAFLRLRNKK